MSVVSPQPGSVAVQAPARSRASLIRTVLNVARGTLVVAVLAAAVLALTRNWAQVESTVWQLSWTSWLPSLLLAPLGILCATASWQTVVDALGRPVGRRQGSQVFLVSQLGKYLPGSVWAYLLQLELGRRVGVSRTRIFAGTVLSTVIAVVAALITACLALPSLAQSNAGLGALLWLYLLVPVGLVVLHPRVLRVLLRRGFVLLRREPPSQEIPLGSVVRAFFWALGSYACFGLHLWVLVTGLPGARPQTLSLCIGTMAVGMLAGLFFFLLPSGVGVREAVIVTALTPVVGAGPALAVAAVSRVFLTLADLMTAGGAALLVRLSARSAD